MKLEEFLFKEEMNSREFTSFVYSLNEYDVANYLSRNITRTDKEEFKKVYRMIFNRREKLKMYKLENYEIPTKRDRMALNMLALKIFFAGRKRLYRGEF